MKRAIIIVILALQAPLSRAVPLDSTYVAELRRGIGFTLVEQFDSARAVFRAMVDSDSLDHAARLYLAGVDHAEMMDREDYAKKDQFNRAAEAAAAMAERALESDCLKQADRSGPNDSRRRDCDSAWAYLTIGNAKAYVASMEAKAGSWWTAMRRGLAAKGAYLKALEIDPSLYDAYLGLGTYHFWKSAKTEFINWFPLVPDRKDEGIDELKLAVDSSLFSNDLALNSLVLAYLQQERADEALKCAEALHAKYPSSRLFMWAMAFSSYGAGHLHDAVDYFGKIIESLERDSTQNYFNLIECRYHRGEIYYTVHEVLAAKDDLEALLGYRLDPIVEERQRGVLHKAEELLEKCLADQDTKRPGGIDSKNR